MSVIRTSCWPASPLRAMTAGAFAQDVKELRIGLDRRRERSRPTAQLRSASPITSRPRPASPKVSLFPAADYDGVIQGLLGGTIDIAELGASCYAAIYLEGPERRQPDPDLHRQTDGSTGYYSIMVARKDSGITKLEDLKGKKLGFADPDSTSGYLIPNVSLPADTRHAGRRSSSPRPTSAAAMRTSFSPCSTASSTPARPSVRASATSRTATPRATSTRWSTRACSTPTTSSKSGARR